MSHQVNNYCDILCYLSLSIYMYVCSNTLKNSNWLFVYYVLNVLLFYTELKMVVVKQEPEPEVAHVKQEVEDLTDPPAPTRESRRLAGTQPELNVSGQDVPDDKSRLKQKFTLKDVRQAIDIASAGPSEYVSKLVLIIYNVMPVQQWKFTGFLTVIQVYILFL